MPFYNYSSGTYDPKTLNVLLKHRKSILPGIGWEFQELTAYRIPTWTTFLVTEEIQNFVTSSSMSIRFSFSIATRMRLIG